MPSATRLAVAGALVERSMNTDPGLALSAMPPLPSVTSSTIFGSGRDVIVTSQRDATSATDAPADAPRSVQAFIASWLRSKTMTSWFVFLMMLRHMGPPMLPTPMKPTFICACSLRDGRPARGRVCRTRAEKSGVAQGKPGGADWRAEAEIADGECHDGKRDSRRQSPRGNFNPLLTHKKHTMPCENLGSCKRFVNLFVFQWPPFNFMGGLP